MDREIGKSDSQLGLDNSNTMAVKPKGHRFKKGDIGNPKGNNQFTTIVPLINAIDNRTYDYNGRKGLSFWQMVAEKCVISDTILKTVLDKLAATKIEGKGFTNAVVLTQIIHSLKERQVTSASRLD